MQSRRRRRFSASPALLLPLPPASAPDPAAGVRSPPAGRTPAARPPTHEDRALTTQLSLDATQARILVADPIAEDGVARLRSAGHVDVRTGMGADELVGVVGAYDALVVRSETKVTAAVIEAATRLRVIGRAGVGVDNIDIDAATRRGVMVLNAPTGNTIAAAEHAVAMMCALVRNIGPADASMKAGRWDRKQFMGSELREKTLGLLGLGKIGLEVARAAGQGLMMRVIAHDPLVAPERAEQAGVELVDMDRLVRDADILSVHVPLTEQTRGCIGHEQLAAMKRGARIVNVARGGIVDEAALAEALAAGHLAGAAVDVFTTEPVPAGHPLLRAPNILLTPHLGASTVEAQVNVAFDVADQIATVLAGGAARYAVNAPSIPAEELAELLPSLQLAERVGALARQLAGGALRRVTCTYAGELAGRDTIVLTAEVLRGLLAGFTETRVNAINARAVARQHGITLEERSAGGEEEPTAATLTVEVAGAERVVIAGRQTGGRPQVTRINEHLVAMRPEGRYLVGTNQDRPAVIATVAGLLAENGINIAGIEVSRDRPYGHALMLLQTDEPVPQGVLDGLRASGVLETLRAVAL